jgi:hypothetical protein
MAGSLNRRIARGQVVLPMHEAPKLPEKPDWTGWLTIAVVLLLILAGFCGCAPLISSSRLKAELFSRGELRTSVDSQRTVRPRPVITWGLTTTPTLTGAPCLRDTVFVQGDTRIELRTIRLPSGRDTVLIESTCPPDTTLRIVERGTVTAPVPWWDNFIAGFGACVLLAGIGVWIAKRF